MTSTPAAGDRLPTAVVCDDHTLMRHSLVQLLDGVVEVVGEAANGKDALSVIERTQPSVALLDVTMPPPDGLDVAVIVRERWPHIKIVVVTMHTDDATLRRATEVGVDAYLTKSSSADEVRTAIKAAIEGSSWVSMEIAHRLMSLSTHASDALTEREREVLEVLAAGNRISEIATTLFVSEKTVKNHLTSVYAKLGAETAAQAVAIAYRSGLVSTLHPYG